jgi:hypothetical protein
VEIFFTAVFTLELLFNLFGSWYTEFVNDGWSVFDAIVIVISILGLIPSVKIPGLNIMRLVKVFKIVRLFRKLTALRILINAITQSLVPVTYAFAILLLVSSLYSIIATQLFAACDSLQFDCQGVLDHNCNAYGDHMCKSQHFGTFTLALFTFFQMSTGDGWSDVTRGLMNLQRDGLRSAWVAMFFVSYMLIVGTILVQIVVAVLLDEFMNCVAKEKEEMKAAQNAAENAHKRPIPGPLDPLLETMLDYTTTEDLNDKIDFCFSKLDLSENGAVSLQEFNEGLKRMLPSDIKAKLTDADWNFITENGKHCIEDGDQSGEVNREQFRTIMLQQFTLYTRRRVVTSMGKEMGEQAFDTLFTLKTVLTSVEAMAQDVTSVKQQQVMFQQRSRQEVPLPRIPPTDEPALIIPFTDEADSDVTGLSRTSSRGVTRFSRTLSSHSNCGLCGTKGTLLDQAPPRVAKEVGHDVAQEPADLLKTRESLEAAGVPRDFHDGLVSAGLDLETLQLLVNDHMLHSHSLEVLKQAGVTQIGDRIRIVVAIRAGSRVFAKPELPVHPPAPLGHNPEPPAVVAAGVLNQRSSGVLVFAEPRLPVDSQSILLRQLLNQPVSLKSQSEVREGLPNGHAAPQTDDERAPGFASSPPRLFRLSDRFSASATPSPPQRSEKVLRQQQVMNDVKKMLAEHLSKAELEKCKAPQKLNYAQPKGAEQKERPQTQAAETLLPCSRPSSTPNFPVRNSAAAPGPRPVGIGLAPSIFSRPARTGSAAVLPQGYEPPPPTNHAPHPPRR